MAPSRRSYLLAAGGVLMFVAGILCGYVAGQQQGIRNLVKMMTLEAEGGLVQRVEVLAALRSGEIDRGVAELESQLDSLVLNLAATDPRNQALLSAKAYRTAIPPDGPNAPALRAVFERFSEVKAEACSPGLRRLIETSRPGRSE